MIRAVFLKKNGKFYGFDILGHAGFAESGADVVCAAVSSAVMLTSNLITENFGIKAEVNAENDTVSLRCEQSDISQSLISGLKEHLECILHEYKGTIYISIKEDKNHA